MNALVFQRQFYDDTMIFLLTNSVIHQRLLHVRLGPIESRDQEGKQLSLKAAATKYCGIRDLLCTIQIIIKHFN